MKELLRGDSRLENRQNTRREVNSTSVTLGSACVKFYDHSTGADCSPVRFFLTAVLFDKDSDMANKGNKDTGKKEEKKKPLLSPKEKRQQKNEKKAK